MKTRYAILVLAVGLYCAGVSQVQGAMAKTQTAQPITATASPELAVPGPASCPMGQKRVIGTPQGEPVAVCIANISKPTARAIKTLGPPCKLADGRAGHAVTGTPQGEPVAVCVP